MKINLNQKDLEKLYHLFDVKEINKSIAEALLSIYEEKKYFKGCQDDEEFFSKILSYLDISSDNKEDIDIFKRWVRPSIKSINDDFLKGNPYYQNIKPTSLVNSHYKLYYEKFASYQPFPLDDIEVNDIDYQEITPISYFKNEQDYLALSLNDEIWMSITPNEINTMKPHIEKAKGDVLVLGLGLGYYPYMISLRKEVKHITIIELDKNIIDLFNQYIFPHFENKNMITVIQGDAVEYLKKTSNHYDTIFADLWHNPEDGLPLYLKIKQLEENHKKTNFQYWIEKSLIALYRRCYLSVIEEALMGFKQSTYLKAENELDKVVNSIYFKTKNITINKYDDIVKLLSDEELLKLIIS